MDASVEACPFFSQSQRPGEDPQGVACDRRLMHKESRACPGSFFRHADSVGGIHQREQLLDADTKGPP